MRTWPYKCQKCGYKVICCICTKCGLDKEKEYERSLRRRIRRGVRSR